LKARESSGKRRPFIVDQIEDTPSVV